MRLHQRCAGFAELVHVAGIGLGGMAGIHEGGKDWFTGAPLVAGEAVVAGVRRWWSLIFSGMGGVWQKSARVWG